MTDVVIHCLVATSHLVGVRKEAGRVSLPPNLGWAQPHRCCPHLLSTRCMCWGLVMWHSSIVLEVVVGGQ